MIIYKNLYGKDYIRKELSREIIIYLLQEQAKEGWLLVDNGQEKTALSFLHLDNFPRGFVVDIKDAKQIACKFLLETP